MPEHSQCVFVCVCVCVCVTFSIVLLFLRSSHSHYTNELICCVYAVCLFLLHVRDPLPAAFTGLQYSALDHQCIR